MAIKTHIAPLYDSLEALFPTLPVNTMTLNDADNLKLHEITDGIIIVFAAWSGPAISICKHSVQQLCDQNYAGLLIIIDIDCMEPDFQTTIFGQICQGWGEIFIVKEGKIVNRFIGPRDFEKLKNYINSKFDVNRLKEFADRQKTANILAKLKRLLTFNK
jgi:hypothetical protein